MTRVLLYSPANLNTVDGSSIWVQSVAETLAADPRVRTVLPLKAPERRDLITGALRSRSGIEVLDPGTFKRRVRPAGLELGEALDWIEHLDRAEPFDALVLRSYELCLAAAARPALKGRLWSTYILEPERDLGSRAYLEGMRTIIEASEFAVCQSEEMRQLLEHAVPAARGRTILLPPAIPDDVPRAEPGRVVRRLVYTGKFHPFYPVPDLIDAFVPLRSRYRDLEFHVVGDKIWRTPEDHAYADALEARLGKTPGLVWHGAISRAAVASLLAEGGVALSIWDHRFGPRSNDLVVSTKLLDYCAAGVPVVLNRTIAQEGILGEDYPLFVDGVAEVPALLDRLLGDADLYRLAAARCWTATRRFTYPAVVARLSPYLTRPLDPEAAAAAIANRDKLDGAPITVGLRAEPAAEPDAGAGAVAAADPVTATRRARAGLALLRSLRARDDRFRLSVLAGASSDAVAEALAEAPDLGAFTTVETTLEPAPWAMSVGWEVVAFAAPAAGLLDADGQPHGAIGGSIPVALPDAAGADLADIAEAITSLVAADGWAPRSAALRHLAPPTSAGAAAR